MQREKDNNVKKYNKEASVMANRELKVLDFEEIWNMARDLIFNIMAEGMFLDDEGNYVFRYVEHDYEKRWKKEGINLAF